MRLIVPLTITAACLVTSTVGLPALVQQQPLLPTNQSIQRPQYPTVQYNGHQVIEVMANTEQQLSALDVLRQVTAFVHVNDQYLAIRLLKDNTTPCYIDVCPGFLDATVSREASQD
jgi:hypothetical protein